MANITAAFKLSNGQGRALILFSILFSAFNLRTAVTSLTPLLNVLGQDFGLDSTMIGVLGMLPTISFALAGIITPLFMRAINLELTILLSMIFAFIGLLLRAIGDSLPFFIVTSLISLLGMGMGNVVLPPLVKRYFPDQIGRISIYYIFLLQIGTLVPAFLAVPLEQLTNWRISLGIWAVFAFISVLFWAHITWYQLRIARKSEKLGQNENIQSNALNTQLNSENETKIHTTIDKTIGVTELSLPESSVPNQKGRIWRSPLAWGLSLMFGMTSLNTYAMFSWLPKIFSSAGGSNQFGGNMVGLFSTLGIVSAFLSPMIAVRLKNPFPFIVLCALFFASGYIGLLVAPMSYPIIWVTLIGLGPSTFPLALTLINLRTLTPEGSGKLSSFGQGIGYGLSCLGPLLFGLIHDWFDNWIAPFMFLGFCLIILLVGGFIVSQPRTLEKEW